MRWIPALGFGGFGLFLAAGGLLKAGVMAYYNLGSGPIRFTGVNPTLDNIALTARNFGQVAWGVVVGTIFLAVAQRWLSGESRRAMWSSVGGVVAMYAMSALVMLIPKPVAGNRPVAAAPTAPGPPVIGAAVDGRPTNLVMAMMRQHPGGILVSIFLDRMTDSERSAAEQTVKREFPSLAGYVPETALIEGGTLYWKATIAPPQVDQHKAEAIAILRKHNIRLSKFSEDWLKLQGQVRPNSPYEPARK